jgi:hypothetical protein
MKSHLKRILIPLIAGALLLGTASCGKRESWLPFGEKKSTCELAYESLESQFRDLKTSVTGGATAADRTAFWQATAALFIVLCGFALVGGAALGSRARRARARFRKTSATSTTPGEFAA